MLHNLKKVLGLLSGVLITALLSIFIFSIYQNSHQKSGEGYGPRANIYQLIGTSSSPANLTTSYNANSSTIYTQYAQKLVLNIRSTFASTTTWASILVEGSNDGGTTYYPVTNRTASTTEFGVFAEDPSGNVGIPFVFPGDKTVTATSTVYYGTFMLDIGYEMMRVSAKATTSTPTSTISIQATTISY